MLLGKPDRSRFKGNRIPITVEQYFNVDYFIDWDIDAYLHSDLAVTNGMDPWRLIGGMYPTEGKFALMCGVAQEIVVDKNYIIYVSESDFDEAVKETEKYWVGTNSEEPLEIMFNRDEAFDSTYRYVDSFDARGKRVAAYKLKDDNSGYTQDF